MAMATAYLTHLGTVGPDVITHLGLVDETGTELAGGTYARLAVTWTDAATARPTTDKVFNVPAGSTVAGWRGFSASSGGTNYGGADLTQEDFASAGTYTLLAAATGIIHQAS
jgi:hypothetical protein